MRKHGYNGCMNSGEGSTKQTMTSVGKTWSGAKDDVVLGHVPPNQLFDQSSCAVGTSIRGLTIASKKVHLCLLAKYHLDIVLLDETILLELRWKDLHDFWL